MKILLAAHFFPPGRNAGAERRALGYAVALQKLGHAVQVVCAGDWEVGGQHWNGYRDEVYQGVPVRRVNLNWTRARDPNRSLYDNPLVEEHLPGWLAEWQPDVVHAISLLTLGAGLARAVKKAGIPLVFTLVDFWMICPKISLVRGDGSLCDGQTTNWDCLKCLLWNTRIYRGLSRALPAGATEGLLTFASRQAWLNRQRGLRGMALDMASRRRTMAEIGSLADCVTAPSTHLGKLIDASGIFPRPVQVIHSGHDLAWLADMPERQPAEVLRLGYIGQLIPVKGVDLLIRAFQDAAEQGKARLEVYGDADSNPQFAALLRAMTRPGDGIEFMGTFPHPQLGRVLAGLDVLVVPSQWHENNPRVIQEAFAGRTPVIASNVGGISEFIEDGVNGLLFQHDRVDDLSAQIRRLIDEPGLAGHLQRGIRRIKTIEEEMREFCDIYESLLESKPHAG